MARVGRPFETERLHFRMLTRDDVDAIHRQFSDPDMCRYFSDPPMSRSMAIETIDMFQRPEQDPFLRYGLFQRSNGEFVGTCGYHHLDRERSQVELGYDIWKAFWRQGYATEVLVPLLRICFVHLEVDLVYVLIHRENTGSIATAQKMGLVPSEPCRPLDAPDQVCMKLTRTAWECVIPRG